MSDGAKGFLAGVGLILAIWAISAVAGSSDSTIDTSTPNTSAPSATTPTTARDAAETTVIEAPEYVQFSNLDPITLGELPPEAIDTVNLILDGGPYPFSKDDSVFQNREGILPDYDRGHYREYTVITPGSSDRGARRIVAGDLGEMYYTSDHYQSFREILL